MANIRCKRDKLARAFFLSRLCEYVSMCPLIYVRAYVQIGMHLHAINLLPLAKRGPRV